MCATNATHSRNDRVVAFIWIPPINQTGTKYWLKAQEALLSAIPPLMPLWRFLLKALHRILESFVS